MVGKGPVEGSGEGQGLVREESSVEAGTALVRVAGAASGDLVSEWEAEKTRVRFPSRQFLADVYASMAPETGLVGAEREARAREQELSWRLRYARILRSPRSERWRGGAASDDGRLKSAQGVVGLLNLGNTCYVNSLLQCLLHTRELRALLCSGDVAADCREGALLPGALAALAHAAWTSKMLEEEPLIRLDPLPIYRVLKRRLGLPGDGEQHDAQELLLSLLDRLSEETNLRGGDAREEPELVWLLSLAEEWDIARETEARRNSSPIDGLFQSWELSQTTCGGCHGRSYSFASQRVLSVPLAAGASPSIQDCLEAYFRGEELAEEVGWRCPHCRRVQRCGKRLYLLRPPPVLVLCLKRFTGPPRPRRLDTPVRVPAEVALGRFGHPELVLGPAAYALYAVVAHHGSLHFGHYTAAVALEDGGWAGLDDASVSRLSHAPRLPDLLHQHSPYILFFRNTAHP